MFQRFVPTEFRPLLEYISPAAFGVIDWRSAVSQFGAVSRRLMDPDAAEAFFHDELPVKLCADPGLMNKAPHSQRLGMKILELYFAQFQAPQPTFLDLRLTNYFEEDGEIYWSPTRLIHEFDPAFRAGMLQVYRGYYRNQPETLLDGMLATGLLTAETSPDVAKRTTALLFQHFGDPEETNVTFSLTHFRDSFHALFMHLKHHQIRLPADFLFLGVYLVTLYWALEKLGLPLNVCEAFEKAIKD